MVIWVVGHIFPCASSKGSNQAYGVSVERAIVNSLVNEMIDEIRTEDSILIFKSWMSFLLESANEELSESKNTE